jgi:uncharacterized protein YciI
MATHRFVVQFAAAPDGADRPRELEEEEKAYILQAGQSGGAVSIGRLKDSSRGALALFDSREAAEAFIEEDQFCTNGAVDSWGIDEFNEVASGLPNS